MFSHTKICAVPCVYSHTKVLPWHRRWGELDGWATGVHSQALVGALRSRCYVHPQQTCCDGLGVLAPGVVPAIPGAC